MTLYWWKHWFWITVWGVVLIECTPLSSVDSYPVKLSSKLEENSNKSTYLKRAGELASPSSSSSGGSASGPAPSNANASGKPGGGPLPFISSLPPMAAASSGLQLSSSSGGAAPTVNSIVAAAIPEPMPQDVDDTFPSGSLAGTDFGPDVTRFARTDAGGSTTTEGEALGSSSSTTTVSAATVVGSGSRFKKNGTIFTRNEQNITTLKLKNYNRGLEKEDQKAPLRMPDRGTRLVDSLMLTAVVENSTEPMEQLIPAEPQTEVEPDEGSGGNVNDANIPEDVPSSENVTFPVRSGEDHLQTPASSDNNRNSSSSSSISFSSSSSEDSSNSGSGSSEQRDIPDSHSDSSSGADSIVAASDRRIGKILSSDYRDFVSNGAGNPTNPNASSYISRAIAFSTQDLQEGVDDQDHPLEEDDYRRSSRSQQRFNVGAISGICLAALGLLTGISAALIILYRRYLYLNKPQTLSEPDSSGYIDDSTIRDNSDEMYSLDNDSFLNSLEAMTIQNYWTDNVKHTKL